MAYTHIHAIKQTLSKALDYIENPEKTDYTMLVSGYNVDPYVASLEMDITAAMARQSFGERGLTNKQPILAYHMIQSFAPTDNVTPEEAHKIGEQLANEMLEGKYEYVVSTHIDKGHIHNHIIFNATSFYDFKKFKTQPSATVLKIRSISDRLCADAGLSVIKGAKLLGRSYQYTPQKSSFRRDIRMRLRFVLEAATSYEEYTAAINALGVSMDDHGKYSVYKMEGQQKGARDRTLDKAGAFDKDAIEERVEENAKEQTALKARIRTAASTAANYDDFIGTLAAGGITCKKAKNNNIQYLFGDDGMIKEWALGSAYSTAAIKSAIQNGDFSFVENAALVGTVADEFAKTAKPTVPAIKVRIKRDMVDQTTVDGIAVNIQAAEEQERLFIDKDHIIYDPERDEFEAVITTTFNYVVKTPDGDKTVRGEKLIRALELQSEVEPTIIELSAPDIQSVNANGVSLSIPEFGMRSFFIPSEYVEYDSRFGGSCKVALWPDWSYNFQSADMKQRYVIGKDLINELEKRSKVIDGSLAGRIGAMQRRNLLADTKELANTLNLLRRERIETEDDFGKATDALQKRIGELHEQIVVIKEKSSQYKLAAKYLVAYNQYKNYRLELLNKRNPAKIAEFKALHDGELKALDYATQQLQKMGVNLDVDPEKVTALTEEQTREVSELTAKSRELSDRVRSIIAAQNVVERIQEPHRAESEHKAQSKNKEVKR